MPLQELIALANSFAALGVTGTWIILGLLFFTGKLHGDKELKYIEALRSEAADDRKTADETVKKLTETMIEQNELTRRSLDLNERLVNDYVTRRAPTKRGGS